MRSGLGHARLISHHHAYFVDAAASDVYAAVGRRRHIADHTAARRNRSRPKGLRLRIEAHNRVFRKYPGLAIPNHSVRRDRDSVGTRLRSPWRWPEFHFACGGTEAAQAALLIISEIDDVIFG